MLLYLVLLLIVGSLFIAVNASPELNHLVNNGIGSRAIVVLSAITVMQGCKLHNGSMIAAALMATWYCLANTGNIAVIGGGPTYWMDLPIPFAICYRSSSIEVLAASSNWAFRGFVATAVAFRSDASNLACKRLNNANQL